VSRRLAFLLMGLGVFIASVLPPVESAASKYFSVHMVQHIAMILVAALLFALARIVPSRIPALRSVVVVGILHAVALWAWHMPVLYDAAMENAGLHVLEHLSLLGTAVLFWNVVLDLALDRLKRVALVFATMLQSSALGALIAFAATPLYGWHSGHTPAGYDVLEQQQLAGAIMWIPAGAVYLVVMLALLRKVLLSYEAAEQS
jgi:putative membrane protein